jgi:TolA-binding protein
VLTAAACGILVPALACWGPEYDSVHFNDARPDFLRMPEPWPGGPGDVRAQSDLTGKGNWNSEEEGAPPADPNSSEALVRKALGLEQAGRFREAVPVWQRFADRDEYASLEAWNRPPRDWSQGVRERIEALRAWRGAQDTPPLRAYLSARDRITEKPDARVEAELRAADRGPLRLHARYLRATLRFHAGKPEESAAAYRDVLKARPGYLPALYMIGRSYFAAVSELESSEELATMVPPTPTPERTALLRKALEAYRQCAAAGPNQPLGRDAVGMEAACQFRLHDYPAALHTYCKQLAAVPPGGEDGSAFVSARWTLRLMNRGQHLAFQKLALDTPEAASIYLDLLLRYGRSPARANQQLGTYALELLRRHPKAPVAGRLLTRLSLIEDRNGQYVHAERLAARALPRCRSRADQDEARWQHALALHHLGRSHEALADYERVAEGAVTVRMRAGAHEAAAVVSEKLGDLPNAIRHYFALGYRNDYGYVVDCLATPDDLRAFLKRFPSHPKRNLVSYSLGFRQLRAGEYEAAAKTFAALGTWLDQAEKAYDATTSKETKRTPPLAAARFLAAAKRREQAAKTPAERARYAYEAGQFIFRQRHLVFYNGALWQGARTWALDLNAPNNLEDRNAKLSPAEEAKLARYQEQHAALYQALQVFLRVADQYPKSPEAPKALYSAALCYSFLPTLERYWANRTDLNYEAKAVALYRRLQRDYPNDPLVPAAAKYGGPLPAAGGASQ